MSTNTPTNTPTPTDQPADTPTPTDQPADTPTPTDQPADTPTPTDQPTATPMPTDQPVATSTPIVITPIATRISDSVVPPLCAPNQTLPVDLMLVIDRSTSMDGQALDAVKQATRAFIEQLRSAKGDRIGLVTFARDAQLDHPLGDSSDAVIATLQDLTGDQGSNISAGIEVAQRELTGPAHHPDARSVIVLLSDGRWNRGQPPDEVATAAKDAGTRIIVIGIGRQIASVLLGSLASDGSYYEAPQPSDLPTIYAAITETRDGCGASDTATQKADGRQPPSVGSLFRQPTPTPSPIRYSGPGWRNIARFVPGATLFVP